MEKIQVFLREDQKAALRSLARRLGLRQSDLVRQGVDLLIDSAAERDADWRAATRAASGIWRDRADIDEASPEIRRRARSRFSQVYEGE